MSYKLNIRNLDGEWDNALQARYVEILDTSDKFTSQYVDEALDELYDEGARRKQSTLDPAVTNDGADGYRVGDVWVNITTDEAFICVDSTNGAAVWTNSTATTTEQIRDAVAGMVSDNTESNITVTYDASNQTFDFDVATATDSVLGIASFDNTFFDVNAGHVSISDNSIDTLQLVSESVTVTELADNIDATGIGFDADMVDGRDVNDNDASTNSLWTSSKITDYVSGVTHGLYWQDPVIGSASSEPSSPNTGDRYLLSGNWGTGLTNDIAEYNGSSWEFFTPSEGYAFWNETDDVQMVWNGSSWVRLGTTLIHSNFQGLGDDDHTQYVHNTIDRTITAQHTFAPASAQSPFVLGSNAQEQLVSGLNTDLLNGQDWTVAYSASEPVSTQSSDIWIELEDEQSYIVTDDGDNIVTDDGDNIIA